MKLLLIVARLLRSSSEKNYFARVAEFKYEILTADGRIHRLLARVRDKFGVLRSCTSSKYHNQINTELNANETPMYHYILSLRLINRTISNLGLRTQN